VRKLFRRFHVYAANICSTIRKALGIGRDAQFRSRCILDAELVLWDRDQQKIEEFHLLSNYLFQRRRPNDSIAIDPNRRLNLMAIFFDVLFVDELVLVHQSYTDRTNILARMVSPEPGKVISISKPF
jgi:DNA ligase 4